MTGRSGGTRLDQGSCVREHFSLLSFIHSFIHPFRHYRPDSVCTVMWPCILFAPQKSSFPEHISCPYNEAFQGLGSVLKQVALRIGEHECKNLQGCRKI